MTDQSDVREAFKTQIPIACAPTPFHDTINSDDVDAITDLTFVTCEFDVYLTEPLCYELKTQYKVSGVCIIYVLSQPGIGDKPATTLSDQLVTYFTQLIELPGTNILITSVTPAVEETSSDANNHYVQSISVEYEYFN